MPFEAMPHVNLVTFLIDDQNVEVEAVEGESLMEVAVKNNVPGISGDCGGGCACGTCRVFVDAQWRSATGEASEMELAMLDAEGDVSAGARLACQIRMTSELSGIRVSIVSRQ